MELEYKFEIQKEDLYSLIDKRLDCFDIKLNKKTDLYFENEEKQRTLKNGVRYINRVRTVEYFQYRNCDYLLMFAKSYDPFSPVLSNREYFITHKVRRTVDGNEINDEREIEISPEEYTILKEMLSSLNSKGDFCFMKQKFCLSFEKIREIPSKLKNNEIDVNIDISKIIDSSNVEHYWFEIEAVGESGLSPDVVFKNLDIYCWTIGLDKYLDNKDNRMWKEILKEYGIKG